MQIISDEGSEKHMINEEAGAKRKNIMKEMKLEIWSSWVVWGEEKKNKMYLKSWGLRYQEIKPGLK